MDASNGEFYNRDRFTAARVTKDSVKNRARVNLPHFSQVRKTTVPAFDQPA